MGFLDRFKKKKEQELGGVDLQKSEEAKTDAKPAGKKSAKPASDTKKKTEAKPTVKKTTKTKKVVRAEIAGVILSPVITEKATRLASVNQYVFRVVPKSTRIQVRMAFRELYGVMPIRVNIINMRAESVRFGRIRGKKKAWKKAIITVPKGKEIQIYEGV